MSIYQSVRDGLRLWLVRGALKAATMPVPLVPEWARHSFLRPTFRALCEEGVRANGAVLSCLETLAFAFPEPRLGVWQMDDSGKSPLPSHPADRLLQRPNPQMGQAELLTFAILYMAIGGNCYLYKVRSAARRVVELWPLNDSQIRPVGGGSVLVDHYEWDDDSGQPHIIPESDIIQLKWMPDPLEPWRGLPPLKAVAREVDTDAAAGRYLYNLLRNDAIPRVVIIAAQGAKVMSETDKLRFDQQYQERYGGDNRGKVPMILGNTADIKTLSLNLQELAFEALRRVPEARICAAFRVPAVLAGLNVGLENATYANVEGLTRWFTERTLAPLWRLVADEIGVDLLREFSGGENLVIAFDLDGVAALREDRDKVWTRASNALSKGGITLNEFRALVGRPSDPAGDVYYLPLAVQVIPFGRAPESPALPAPIAKPPPAEDDSKALSTGPRLKGRAERRQLAVALIAAQREQRRLVASRMEPALDAWFAKMADRVISRALQSSKVLGRGERKGWLDAEYLLEEYPDDKLVDLVKRFYLELIQLSWDTWNLNLGVEVAFDLTDPAVTQALANAGTRIKGIQDTTLQAVRDALQYGSEQGWSVDHLVRGDPANGIRGLRDIVEQTYKNRGRTIARTELGTAQSLAATERFRVAGVTAVLCLDNGVEDSHPACQALGQGGQGSVVPLSWAAARPLQHPNCLRCYAAVFDEPIDEAALQAWQAAGGDS